MQQLISSRRSTQNSAKIKVCCIAVHRPVFAEIMYTKLSDKVRLVPLAHARASDETRLAIIEVQTNYLLELHCDDLSFDWSLRGSLVRLLAAGSFPYSHASRGNEDAFSLATGARALAGSIYIPEILASSSV